MAVDAAHALYVYGGAPQSGPMHGDLWTLSTGTWTWQELKPQGRVPEVRGACGEVPCWQDLLLLCRYGRVNRPG